MKSKTTADNNKIRRLGRSRIGSAMAMILDDNGDDDSSGDDNSNGDSGHSEI
tara:strand:+ start:259 stop:414 length:156 start_codon:yes stop_codon:yes gene_type:complete